MIKQNWNKKTIFMELLEFSHPLTEYIRNIKSAYTTLSGWTKLQHQSMMGKKKRHKNVLRKTWINSASVTSEQNQKEKKNGLTD